MYTLKIHEDSASLINVTEGRKTSTIATLVGSGNEKKCSQNWDQCTYPD
jgi:hypothetical protein